MSDTPISPNDNYSRKRAMVLDSEMAYVDVGAGDPVVFLHGNPTSSYLWRNIIPYLAGGARCLAPDLIGMGASGGNPAGSYRFVDHARYLDAWLETVSATRNATFVIHDWGSALGFHWGNRHREAVKGFCYMEAIVMPVEWDDWPEGARRAFQGLRSEAGEGMVLENNMFVERILPGSILRTLTEQEMDAYRRPFAEGGEVRRPTLTWPREIPLGGEPADVVEIVQSYADWLTTSDVPKLLVNAEPGAILNGRQLEFARSWPNTTEVTVPGNHFIQEDSPHEIGQALRDWYEGL
jgi:haloalkane dehalogenase